MSSIARKDAEMTQDAGAMSAPSCGSLPLDQIICGDNCEVMRQMPSESIDLVVTSPPYDDLRTYGGHSWDFYGVAWNLKRLLKPGGVIVWVTSDQTIDGCESASSMSQALHFRSIGLTLHDTMVWAKKNPRPTQHTRYESAWEYVFVVSKGRPSVINLLREPSLLAGGIRKKHRASGGPATETGDGVYVYGETKIRKNVWEIAVGRNGDGHPAAFPNELARDHILSWSNEGDVVLDPFSGSGTTAKMARETGRRFIGIEVNHDYVEISRKRLAQQVLPMGAAS